MGHPSFVMGLGGFLGGVAAGVIHADFLGFLFLTLGATYGLLAALGHIHNAYAGSQLGQVIGLSTVLSMPAGFAGMLLARSLWG
ncbi:hypothetical protein [Ramlibacter henchirensis]|uniref:hypothetical protein n=1 Tax=Ramlibacter henchirensis TaxID=204072 RepID=UPI001076AECD|nr:hypothetical protein [Ramlibacter henchirensis]